MTTPPKLTHPQRKLYFDLPEWGIIFLRTLVASHSRGGFALQVGYFKATGRFFSVERFLAADKEFVQQQHQLGAVDWTRYDWTTSANHRQHILRQFGVTSFEDVLPAVLEQFTHFARHQMHPVAVFRSAAEYIRAHRWEVPTYAALAGVATEAFRTVEQHLTTQLAHHLTPALRQQLDALFTTEESTPAHPHPLSADAAQAQR